MAKQNSGTASIAGTMSGSKLYQERAREALPLLVRQAEVATPIFYSSLAHELGMPNPRNLNYVLGSIGQTLEQMSRKWKEKIPPIQCLVINKNTGLPGAGIGWFLIKKAEYAELPLRRRREIVQAELQHIFAFKGWREVLHELSLSPAQADFAALIDKVGKIDAGGESLHHKSLKEFVARNPRLLGLPAKTPFGQTEVPLLSGDSLDVSFRTKKLWLAVEVKSAISPQTDIVRGVFQCIKYRAVLDATLLAESSPQNARAILALESSLPAPLIALCNLLGVEVIERIRKKVD